MRLLIVGLGSIGQRHLQNLRKLGVAEILAWRVRNCPLPASISSQELELCQSLEEGLASNPDAVLICNPTSLHLPVALKVAESGCHFFIEKPLSNCWNGVDRLLSIARERELVTLIGFNLRFHPGLKLIKSLIEEGRVGRLVSIRAQVGQHLPDWHPWEDHRKGYSARRDLGGGVVLDLIHELDYVRWLAGPVCRVSCFMAPVQSLGIETEAVAEVLLHFENGAIGNVHMDYVQRSPSRTCRIIGEEGTITWDYFSNHVRLFSIREPSWKVFRQEGLERNDTFLAEMRHFLACLEGRETPVVDLEEGARVLRLALAAREAAEDGRLVAVE